MDYIKKWVVKVHDRFLRFFRFSIISQNLKNLKNLTYNYCYFQALVSLSAYLPSIPRLYPPYTLRSPLNSRRSRSNGAPKILIFWESGGASRLNADEVSSPCDLVTEREITGSLRVHTERILYLLTSNLKTWHWRYLQSLLSVFLYALQQMVHKVAHFRLLRLIASFAFSIPFSFLFLKIRRI